MHGDHATIAFPTHDNYFDIRHISIDDNHINNEYTIDEIYNYTDAGLKLKQNNFQVDLNVSRKNTNREIQYNVYGPTLALNSNPTTKDFYVDLKTSETTSNKTLYLINDNDYQSFQVNLNTSESKLFLHSTDIYKEFQVNLNTSGSKLYLNSNNTTQKFQVDLNTSGSKLYLNSDNTTQKFQVDLNTSGPTLYLHSDNTTQLFKADLNASGPILLLNSTNDGVKSFYVSGGVGANYFGVWRS